jgi:ADP-heptose:LPS heptosyltransferase
MKSTGVTKLKTAFLVLCISALTEAWARLPLFDGHKALAAAVFTLLAVVAPLVCIGIYAAAGFRQSRCPLSISDEFRLSSALLLMDANGKIRPFFILLIAAEAGYMVAQDITGALVVVALYVIVNLATAGKPKREETSSAPIVDIPFDERDRWHHLPKLEQLVKEKLSAPMPAEGRLVIVRGGEMGDVLMTTPTLRKLKERYPGMHISYITRIPQALRGNRNVDSIVRWQSTISSTAAIIKADRVIDYRGVIEKEHRPAVPLLAEMAGVILDRGTPEFHIPQKDLEWAKSMVKPTAGRILAIQGSANSATRSWPIAHVKDLTRIMSKNGWKVVLLDNTRINMESVNGVADLSGQTTFMQAAAVVSLADMLVGPDSSFIHLSAAFGVPAVGIFSVIPPTERAVTYPLVRAVTPLLPCAPCYDQSNRCTQEPMYQCMKSISPQSVADAVESFYMELCNEAHSCN